MQLQCYRSLFVVTTVCAAAAATTNPLIYNWFSEAVNCEKRSSHCRSLGGFSTNPLSRDPILLCQITKHLRHSALIYPNYVSYHSWTSCRNSQWFRLKTMDTHWPSKTKNRIILRSTVNYNSTNRVLSHDYRWCRQCSSIELFAAAPHEEWLAWRSLQWGS